MAIKISVLSFEGHWHSPYLDLDGPWEVADIDIEGDVWVASEGELLTGETVSVFLDVGFGHDGHLFSRNGSGCWGKRVHVFNKLLNELHLLQVLSKNHTGSAATYYYESINGFIKPVETTGKL